MCGERKVGLKKTEDYGKWNGVVEWGKQRGAIISIANPIKIHIIKYKYLSY